MEGILHPSSKQCHHFSKEMKMKRQRHLLLGHQMAFNLKTESGTVDWANIAKIINSTKGHSKKVLNFP